MRPPLDASYTPRIWQHPHQLLLIHYKAVSPAVDDERRLFELIQNQVGWKAAGVVKKNVVNNIANIRPLLAQKILQFWSTEHGRMIATRSYLAHMLEIRPLDRLLPLVDVSRAAENGVGARVDSRGRRDENGAFDERGALNGDVNRSARALAPAENAERRQVEVLQAANWRLEAGGCSSPTVMRPRQNLASILQRFRSCCRIGGWLVAYPGGSLNTNDASLSFSRLLTDADDCERRRIEGAQNGLGKILLVAA